MAKPPIQYRPGTPSKRKAETDAADALEAYKAEQRAKILARVHKHRAFKAAAREGK